MLICYVCCGLPLERTAFHPLTGLPLEVCPLDWQRCEIARPVCDAVSQLIVVYSLIDNIVEKLKEKQYW